MKKSVRFEYLNLARDIFPSVRSGTRGMDLIFCRNVLMYYDEQTAHSIVSRLYRSLSEGGWLITGTDDPPMHEFDMFDFIPTEHGLAYRRANHSPSVDSLSEPELSPSSEVPPPPAAETEQRQPAVETRERPRVAKPLGNKRLAEARAALAEGDYQRAADLTDDLRGQGAIIHVKAMASIDLAAAAEACQTATSKRPLSQELHYLNAVLMMDLNRHHEAAESLRRVLFLDESLALVHFSLGAALRSIGDFDGARQAFRSTVALCDSVPPDQPVPLGDKETAGQLRALAKTQLDSCP
jgi:chemotaxis protein methyltransferase CheR